MQADIPRLVAQVYEAAPADQRVPLITQLLQPLGLLSLVAVADGVFAKFRFRGGWQALSVRIEDLWDVRSEHVMALADYAQQVSVEAVDGLAGVLSDAPMASGSAAAVLVALLLQRAHARQQRSRPTGLEQSDQPDQPDQPDQQDTPGLVRPEA